VLCPKSADVVPNSTELTILILLSLGCLDDLKPISKYLKQ